MATMFALIRLSIAMDKTKDAYVMFHQQLVLFLDTMKSKLKSDTGLDHIDVVASIITPDSDAFDRHDVDFVINQIMLVSDMTDRIVEKGGDFVDDSDWFAQESQTIGFYLGFVKMALLNLRSENSGVVVVKEGIGGINKGYYNSMNNEVLEQIRNIVKTLS